MITRDPNGVFTNNIRRTSLPLGEESTVIGTTTKETIVTGIWFLLKSLLLIGTVIAVLRLEDRGYVLIVIASFLCIIMFYDFSIMWLIDLLIFPFLTPVSTILDMPKLSAVRLLLIGPMVFVIFNKKLVPIVAPIFRHSGFAAFAFFVLVSFVSAIAHMDIEFIYRAATYIEPAVFCMFTYYIAVCGNAKKALATLVLSGAVVAAFGTIEWIEQRPILDILGIVQPVLAYTEDLYGYFSINRMGLGGRIVSFIGQPVYMSMYLGMWLILISHYVTIYKPFYRLAIIIIIPFTVLLILATGTRAFVFASIPAILVLLYFTRFKRATLPAVIITAIAVVVFIGIYVPDLSYYIESALNTGEYTEESVNFQKRIELAYVLVQVFKDNPIIGCGPGLIQKSAFAMGRFYDFAGVENQYALILAETGILGAIAYAIFVVAILREAWTMAARSYDPVLRQAGLLLLLVFVFNFAFVLSVNSLTGTVNNFAMAIYGAVLGHYDHFGNNREG